MEPLDFPIAELLPAIRASLAAHPRLVLEAPPGAGKTTQVPLALLDAPWLAGRKLVLLEPRRVAARAAAGFMASLLGEAVGDTVGYRIRFENQISSRTRIEVVTEGILTRMIQDDPTLEGIGALLFDEFHERHLASDLGLTLALDVQAQIRDDLRIVAMSATLDGAWLADFLDAPRLRSEGRSFPVQVEHFPARRMQRPMQGDHGEPLAAHACRAIEHALTQHEGDVLVFLPGQREIAQVQRMLGDPLPPPLAGEGWGGGDITKDSAPLPTSPRSRGEELSVEHLSAGHPNDGPSPLAGGDEERLRTAGGRSRAEERPAGPSGSGRGGERIAVLPLHGELPIAAQAAALTAHDPRERRVVLATNVAESSVTLPGVRVVIDSGLAREPRFDPNSGFSRLQTVAISQASAEQRAGRAGRVAEGWAYRLWSPALRLEPQRRAEITQVDLSGLALELAAWGASKLRFPEPPPPGALAAARDLLVRLGALEGVVATAPDPAAAASTASNTIAAESSTLGTITPLGRRMLALGTHPRLAAMLLVPRNDIERALACDLAVLIEARDPLRSRSDALAERWQALAAFRLSSLPSARRGGLGRGGASAEGLPPSERAPSRLPPAGARGGASNALDVARHALGSIDLAAKQWRRRLHLDALPPRDVPAHLLGDLLAHAFPDRIARQSALDPHRYQLANGRSARLLPDSALYGEPWLVVCELRDAGASSGRGPREALILRAAPLDEARLERDFPERFIETDRVRWDATTRALVSRRQRRFDAIVLWSKPVGRIDPQQAAQALCDAIGELGLAALPWTEALVQWRARARCLRAWMPELALPDLSDEALLAARDDWLLPALHGKTRLDALDEASVAAALQQGIDWNLRQRIDTLAPRRIAVPSGLDRAIAYAYDESADAPLAPVLAVKLQELFGLADTPRIADGRIPLTLHLLSPGGKPLQVTQDLRGFWDRTYPEVRKEMKGRYPRHPWPDDPWSAVATHRAKPRGT